MLRKTPSVLPQTIPSLTMSVVEPVSWQKNIDFIKHIILDRNIMIALLGDKRSGKTTFLQFLPSVLAPQITTYRLNASPFMDKATFFQQLHRIMRLGEGRTLTDFIIDCIKQRTHVLLIIDDAQHLTSEWIAMLLTQMVGQPQEEAYFHICLSSDLSIIPILNALVKEKYKEKIHSIEIGALSEDETKIYLRQLLVLHKPEVEVTEEKMIAFYQKTSGRISNINKEYEAFFADEITEPVEPRSYSRLVTMACLGFIVLGIAYLAQSGMFQSFQTFLNANSEEYTAQNKSMPEVEVTLLSTIPGYAQSAQRQPLFPTPLRRAELTVVDKEVAVATDEAMAVMDKVIVAPKVVPKAQEKPVAIVEAVKSVVPVLPKSVKRVKSSRDLAGLYTIQLLASTNRIKLNQFIAEHNQLKGKVRVLQTKKNGKTWYVITWGEFSSRIFADQAVAQLPGDVVHYKPWVRQIADLKNG